MKKFLIILAFSVLTGWSGSVLADTLVLDEGKSLEGTVENPNFRIKTPYSGIRVARQDIKMIHQKEDEPGIYVIQTVNNDLLSGQILEGSVRFALYSGGKKEFPLNRVRRVEFIYNGETKPVMTTIYFMRNGDQFSGRMDNESLGIDTGKETHRFERSEFSRIVFGDEDGSVKEVLLDDGTLVSGELMDTRIQVTPECVTRISLCRNLIKKIQFNAEKLVITKIFRSAEADYDKDGDGVADDQDRCPDTVCYATVDEKGCAREGDADGDGVLDRNDRCPGTPRGLQVDPEGCWMIRITHFDFDQADIREKYYKDLDRIADILNTYPEIRAEVQGHTDSRGTDAYNRLLSQKRAEAVIDYLAEKGVDTSRLKAVGYGESKPIASNRNDEGRELNRRVQIVQVP